MDDIRAKWEAARADSMTAIAAADAERAARVEQAQQRYKAADRERQDYMADWSRSRDAAVADLIERTGLVRQRAERLVADAMHRRKGELEYAAVGASADLAMVKQRAEAERTEQSRSFAEARAEQERTQAAESLRRVLASSEVESEAAAQRRY